MALENLGMPDILQQLDKQHIVFKYINTIADNYKTEEEEPTSIDFKDFAAFESFVKTSDFTFESKNNKLIDELKANLKKDKQMTLLSEVEALEDRIDQEQNMAMETHKAEIISYIEQQLAARNHFQKGKYFQRLDNDTEIAEAISLLNDPARYKSILGK